VTGARLALAVLLLAGVACVDIEIRLRGPARVARPEGCKVVLFPEEKGGPPNIGFEDVAWVTVSCRGRERCIDELRKQACATGSDFVYGFSENTEAGYTHIDARFAARTTDGGGSSRRSYGPDPGDPDRMYGRPLGPAVK